MGKLGDKIRTVRTKIKKWKEENPNASKAASRFGNSMQQSAQNMASSIDSTTTVKGVTVAVNENDLRLNDTTEQLLSTKVGDDLAYAPYDEWIESKNKKT
jgi:hypothetical protein